MPGSSESGAVPATTVIGPLADVDAGFELLVDDDDDDDELDELPQALSATTEASATKAVDTCLLCLLTITSSCGFTVLAGNLDHKRVRMAASGRFSAIPNESATELRAGFSTSAMTARWAQEISRCAARPCH